MSSRKPLCDIEIFKKRRSRLRDLAKGSAFVLPAALENYWIPYRQDSNFFYLTGFDEPESMAVIRPGLSPEFVLFVRPKDKDKEIWDGFRFGPEGAQRDFGADEAYLITEKDRLVDLLKEVERVYYPMGRDEAQDREFLNVLKTVKMARGRSGLGLLPIQDPNEILGEMRLFKTAEERAFLKESVHISALGHIAAMRYTRPGVTERQVLGQMMAVFFGENAAREGYGSIVASGNNATTLHYRFNDQTCQDGDLLLIDAAAEKNYYTGDITRTFPVNGKFTPAQKAVYEAVLTVQKGLIDSVQVGRPYRELQEQAVDRLTEAMLDLKLLKGSKDEIIERGLYRKYYPHSVGHYLGMDVHDVGLYSVKNQPRPIGVGMSFTIEPGLYIPADDESAPVEMRGIGVRIEDDILVTETGVDVMSHEAPKEIDQIEELMRAR